MVEYHDFHDFEQQMCVLVYEVMVVVITQRMHGKVL